MTLQFPVLGAVPDLDGCGELEQVINVPMGCRRGFQVVTDAGTQTARTKGTAHVGIKPRNNIKFTQGADLQPLHLAD